MGRRNQRWDQVIKEKMTLDKLVEAFEIRNRASPAVPRLWPGIPITYAFS